MTRTLAFLAIVVTAIAFVPSGAHLLELANKIGMSEANYFVAQRLYDGWILLGVASFLALGANAALAFATRDQGAPSLLASGATLAMVAWFIVFFVWTFPANQATESWTIVPANWEALRLQWEYSHAANAVLLLVGFCLTVLAGLTSER